MLRAHGYRVANKRTWSQGDAEFGWSLVWWEGDKWNTKQEAEASLNVAVWPTGTAEHHAAWSGSDTAPYAAWNSPVGGDADVITGVRAQGTYAVTADMTAGALAEEVARAEAFTDVLARWAATQLDARASAPLMRRQGYAVAALLAREPVPAEVDAEIDWITARFQRDPRPLALGPIIASWRAERGLSSVPLPEWSRWQDRVGSVRAPRNLLDDGVGRKVTHVSGASRVLRPEDLPDEPTLDRWRAEREAKPEGDGVLDALPPWLPFIGWLEPLPDPVPRPRKRGGWR